MKKFVMPGVLFASVCACGVADAQNQNRPRNRNLPPIYQHEHDHDEHGPVQDGRVRDQTAVIQQRADQVANAIENIQAHLEDDMEAGHGGAATYQLFHTADAALQQTIQFRRTLRAGTPPQRVYDQFRDLDQQVHGLMQAVRQSNDDALQRELSQLAYADERLHAAVATGAGQTSSEFIARQAHVLAAEAQRLERAVRVTIARQDGDEDGRHHGDTELIDAIHRFADRVEHFHETAEHEDDPGHLSEDFALVDESWHQVVELMNRNPHGAYLSRRAQRVGAMHDDLSRVIGVKTERRAIRFNVGGFDIKLGR